ncbi:MAG: Uma2 family endonuclease [Saprospiraceae bacterium]|jgi:Uma2 family endonuclease|nr:Uma2 family endonuclease [Saprospiraceae bacterium]
MDVATLPVLSDYEIERGKPMPSKIHALLTKRLIVFLVNYYPGRFDVLPELTLEMPSERSIPDICICPLEPVDFFHDEVKRKDPPLVTIEILSPSQVLQTLIDKTNDYFSFGVKSCWVVIPSLQSIYVFKGPLDHDVYTLGEELYDPNVDVRIPMDVIFSTKPG